MSPVFTKDNLSRAVKILALPLDLNFSAEEVKTKWRKVIERVHPDAGGTTFLAEEANNAKDLLLSWIQAGRPMPDQDPQGDNPRREPPHNPATPYTEVVAKAIVHIAQASKKIGGWIWGTISLAFWIVVAGFVFNIYERATGPSCEPSNVQVNENIFNTNGEADYGVTVSADLKNSGSEGEYHREVKGRLKQNYNQTITADFPEPTIQAKNFRAEVSCKRG